jgi:hypothetical protein
VAAPVETKVQASTAAAAVSGLALWTLGHYVFKAGVPDVVASWIYVLVPAAVTFAAGYLAKHTDRPVATVTVPVAAAAAVEKTLIRPAAGEPPSSVPGLLAPPVAPPPAAPE